METDIRFHFPGEDMEESLIVRFKKEGGEGVRITRIADYKADARVGFDLGLMRRYLRRMRISMLMEFSFPCLKI